MTANVKFKANPAFKAVLLNSSGAQQVVNMYAARIHSVACGLYDASGYVMRKARPGKVRCHAYVATGDRHAMNSNVRHMTLLKAMRG